MDENNIPPALMSRRFLLAAAGLAGVAGTVGCSPSPAGRPQDKLPDFSLPQENLEGMLRMTASLEEGDVPWWFDGTMFGIVGEEAPRPLVRFEGWEVYWVRPVENNAYELTGHTVTFFYDVETGVMLDTFENPYTGVRNKVEASVQGGGAGFGFNYSVNGVRLTKLLDQLPEQPLLLQWSSVRDKIWMHAETAYPPGLKQPRKQRQTMFAPIGDFLDRNIPNLPTAFSATVFENWPRWMDMGDLPGHVIWHASGAKIGSLDDLPAQFRARLETEYPDRMTADPFTDVARKSTFQ